MLINEGLDEMYKVSPKKNKNKNNKGWNVVDNKIRCIMALEDYVCTYKTLRELSVKYRLSEKSISVYITKYFKKEEKNIALRSRI